MEQATFAQRLAALLVLGFDFYALETDGATSVRITKDHCYAVGRHPSVHEALALAVTAWETLHAEEGMGIVALLNDPMCELLAAAVAALRDPLTPEESSR